MMAEIEATVDVMMATINRVMLEARLKRELEASQPDPLTLMHQVLDKFIEDKPLQSYALEHGLID